MTNLFSKMAKIIILSLLAATTALLILYFIIYRLLINDQIEKAKVATDSLIVMKYSQMLYNKKMKDIINIYSSKTNIDFDIISLMDKKNLPFDKTFTDSLIQNRYKYDIKDNKLIYYRPLIVTDECMKCHTGKNTLVGSFHKGDLIGVLKAVIPIEKQLNNYNKSFIIIFIILAVALVFTLYYFYDYMKTIKLDIHVLLLYFKEKIKKGIYEPIQKPMKYIEFEQLKKEINGAVSSILFYRNEMIKSYLFNDLTNLPNRTKLIEDLKNNSFNLALININKFREINDFFGYETGDKLIILIAKRISALTASYHINIDEFAFALPYNDMGKNKEYVRKIINELEKPYHINDKEIILTFRCGMSTNKDNLLTTADVALEYAKRKKEKCLCFCDIQDTIKEFEKNLHILKILVKAIKNNRVKVFYQDIVDNKTLKTVKYEALVRIEDENGKIYKPNEFLEIAKSANLYPQITKSVFEQALDEFKNKKEMISLNLDFEDIENDTLREFIISKIDAFPEPERITVELLESEDITQSGEIIRFMHYLKSKGVKIFIDDFGSGYSNFSYLFNFEVNGFKIDGSLVKNILTDEKSEMIVQTMVEFAKKGNMRIVAEYVESKEIYEKVTSLGVDCSQGYYFSKPKSII